MDDSWEPSAAASIVNDQDAWDAIRENLRHIHILFVKVNTRTANNEQQQQLYKDLQ